MNCNRCQRLLHEYLDETLSVKARACIEQHLQGCDDCRKALLREQDFSASVSQLLRRHAESLTLRPEAQRNVLDALESGAPSPGTGISHRHILLHPALAMAAAGCLLLAGILIFGRDKPEPHPRVQPVVAHPKSYFMCMATTYSDDTRTDWIERHLIVATRNGGEGYLKIIATKPPKRNQTDQKREEES